jgi:predicted regulator of Ras-like GTPase activity (Roadblock/LC7/MglB family)
MKGGEYLKAEERATAEADLVGQLEGILRALSRKSRGVRGLVVVDANGFPIASDVSAKVDLGVIAAMGALITESANTVFENVGIEGPEMIIMEGRQANIAATSLGQGNASLLAFVDKGANLGLLKIEMRRAALQIIEVLGLGSSEEATIAELFIMSNGGLLIRHYSDSLRTDIDRDVLSGMLVAVQQFVKQTLASKGGNLDEMRYGEHTIAFVRGNHTIAAVVTNGRNTEAVRYRVFDALEEFEERFAHQLEAWDGDVQAFPGIDDIFHKVVKG